LVERRGIYKSEMFNFEKLDVWQEAIEFCRSGV